jgi:tetratricopeptide (TPR) repeat protein
MKTNDPEESQKYILDQLANLQNQIDILNKRLSSDEIAKSIDRSYLSIGNIRAFLQILSIIITIFVASAVYFGSVGLSNILQIREEASRAESIRKSTEDVYLRISKVEGEVSNKANGVDTAISVVDRKMDEEITKLKQKLEADIKQVKASLKNVSEIFNSIAISHANILNAREQQLLTLLASEIDPASPIYCYNAANHAFLFRRYDEAIKYLDVTLNASDLPGDIRNSAAELKKKALEFKGNPPKLQYQEAGGVTVGPYGVLALPINILNILLQNGYLTLTQAQEVIDASRVK